MGTKDWKTALVTGGAGGLGFELARQCAARGMDVVLVGRNEERLVEAAAQLEFEHNIKAHVIVCDLAKVGAAAKVFARVREMGLVVDVLVNNAGFGYDARFVESDMARQRELILTNDLALVELVGEFAPDMAERKCGGILNVASVAGFMPGPDMATYYASKAFVQSFSQAIHVELRRAGVHEARCARDPCARRFGEKMPMQLTPPISRIALDAPFVASRDSTRFAATRLSACRERSQRRSCSQRALPRAVSWRGRRQHSSARARRNRNTDPAPLPP